jgi:hypothetical protein
MRMLGLQLAIAVFVVGAFLSGNNRRAAAG